jgi:predicted aldo/keto reductase-like oxidoreductase
MRIQQTWGRNEPVPQRIEEVDKDCQANLIEIIRASVAQGINHFETAQG